jgi:acetoin utilization deacetylase AcuC-like enzyme
MYSILKKVDFDVHHGNGTEDVVKSLNRPDSLFFCSTHLCKCLTCFFSFYIFNYLKCIHSFIEKTHKSKNPSYFVSAHRLMH